MKSILPKIILFTFLLSFIIPNVTYAELKTFVKEYTYHASEEDSKNSSRTISLREVKRLLLEELGTYLESETEVQNFQLTKDQIFTLTAGIVMVEILDEKWDGHTYWLKAKIESDSDGVVNSIAVLRKDRQKTKELEEVRRRSDELLRENERLRKELAVSKGKKRHKNTIAYSKMIKELTAIDWVEKGYASYLSRDYSNAINAFTMAIKLNPNNANAYIGRGLAYRILGNQSQVISAFDKAIEIDPKNAEVYAVRGHAYSKLGNQSQAISDFDRAIEIDPKDALTYSSRGSAYSILGNQGQAISDFDKAIEIDPKDALTYSSRGLVYSILGNQRQAISDFDKAIEIDPKNAITYSSRGLAYIELGNYGQAITDLKIAARLGHKRAQDYLSVRGVAW